MKTWNVVKPSFINFRSFVHTKNDKLSPIEDTNKKKKKSIEQLALDIQRTMFMGENPLEIKCYSDNLSRISPIEYIQGDLDGRVWCVDLKMHIINQLIDKDIDPSIQEFGMVYLTKARTNAGFSFFIDNKQNFVLVVTEFKKNVENFYDATVNYLFSRNYLQCFPSEIVVSLLGKIPFDISTNIDTYEKVKKIVKNDKVA